MPESSRKIDEAMEAASGPHFTGLRLDGAANSSDSTAATKQPFVIG